MTLSSLLGARRSQSSVEAVWLPETEGRGSFPPGAPGYFKLLAQSKSPSSCPVVITHQRPQGEMGALFSPSFLIKKPPAPQRHRVTGTVRGHPLWTAAIGLKSLLSVEMS